jgi:hypothetical protein
MVSADPPNSRRIILRQDPDVHARIVMLIIRLKPRSGGMIFRGSRNANGVTAVTRAAHRPNVYAARFLATRMRLQSATGVQRHEASAYAQ